jgi:hypothetical protein
MTKDIDASYTDQITCPYCGDERTDSWELGEEGEVECYECGKMFRFTSDVRITYTSERDCELNGEEHEWVYVRDLSECIMESCSHCDQINFEEYDSEKGIRKQMLLGGV